MNETRQEVLRQAMDMFNSAKDWAGFFREVLGRDGIARKAFPDSASYAQFEKSEEHQQIQNMVNHLREKNPNFSSDDDKEPTRVITVRLPKSLHEALKAEAHDRHTSMNQLCIAKLLKMIEDEEAASATQAEAETAGAQM